MEDYSEKIQKYIEGQLRGEELLSFEAQLLIDNDLNNMLMLQMEVHQILHSRIISLQVESRTHCQICFQDYKPQKEDANIFKNEFVLILSVFTLLLVVGVLYFAIQ